MFDFEAIPNWNKKPDVRNLNSYKSNSHLFILDQMYIIFAGIFIRIKNTLFQKQIVFVIIFCENILFHNFFLLFT